MAGNLDRLNHRGNTCDEQDGTFPTWSNVSNEAQPNEQRTCCEHNQHLARLAYFQGIEQCAHSQFDTHKENDTTKHSSKGYWSCASRSGNQPNSDVVCLEAREHFKSESWRATDKPTSPSNILARSLGRLNSQQDANHE